MIKIITPPTLEPVSLVEVKDQLGITDDALDIIITNRIKGAREWVENYCDRALVNQTIEFRLTTFPEMIDIPRPDASSVTYIKYVDEDGVEQTIDSSLYTLDTWNNIIRPVYGQDWPTPRAELNAVRIRYVGGYGSTAASVPDNIRDAIINVVGHWTNYQGRIQAGTVITQVPGAIRKILNEYRTRFF